MNAVFERDFVAFSCSGRFLLIRAGFAVVMGVLVLSKVAPAYTTGNFSDVGSTVLHIAVLLGVVTLVLAAPGAFGTVLVHARAQGSLPVLLSTPLTPMGIALGAFSARAGLLLMFVLATWPPIALALLFGGVRGAQLFEASAATVATALLVASPAFIVSAYARRTGGAVVAAYLLAAAILAGLGLVGGFLVGTDPWLASALSPFHAIKTALEATALDTGGMPAGAYVLLFWSVLLGVGSVVFAAFRLRREGLGDGDPTVPGLMGPRKSRPLRYENPILDHEMRTGTLTDRKTGARGLLALLIATELAFFVATHFGKMDPTSISLNFSIVGFQCVLLVLAVTAAGATTLANEHETHMLDLLRVTPLTPAQIVIGKLLGLVRALFPCLVVPLFHVAYASTLGVFSPLALPVFLLTGTVVLTTWALCGMTQSLEQSDPKRAVLRTMGLMGIFGVISPAMIGVPVMGVFDQIDPYIALSAGAGANPIATMLLALAALRVGGANAENAVVAPPPGGDLGFAFLGGAFWMVLYTVVAFALYRRLFTTYRSRFEW